MPSIQTANPANIASMRSSGRDVLLSGTTHTFTSENLEINLRGLQFILEFKNDSGGVRIEAEQLDSKSIRVKLYNFNNSIGTGTTEPMQVGHLDNRRLYFAFTVYAFDEKSLKTVHYTFFLGEDRNA